jgi:hypothetical protein
MNNNTGMNNRHQLREKGKRACNVGDACMKIAEHKFNARD